jgi:pimeloyl-ACP methyl ester carboxylesterase
MPIAHVNEVDLYFEEEGSGEPLLLIMGLAADSLAWVFQRPAFAQRYRTIVFDNRGVGRSSKPPGPYTTAQMARDTKGLLDALGISRAHVLGVSMGGMIAQELALQFPESVRSLVLACTYAAPDAGVLATRDALVTQLGGRVAPDGTIEVDLSRLDPLQFFQTLMPLVFNPDFLARELPRLMELFASSLQYGFSPQGILGQVAAVLTHNTEDRLAQIRVPTLVLTGDADRLVPPAYSERLAALIPGAKLVKIPGGSHAFNLEQPEAFNRAVLEFLASVQ